MTDSSSGIRNRECLTSIHEQVLKYLRSKDAPTDSTSNREQEKDQDPAKPKHLVDLCRHRIFLASEIARKRSTKAIATVDLNVINGTTNRTRHDATPAIPAPQELQQIRKKRKLTAAYRLGGITVAVPHMDPEMLSFRFDICWEGTYVASYHAFLDVVVSGDGNKLYLRMSQHTIPTPIPILELWQSSMGGNLFVPVGEVHSITASPQLQKQLQQWSHQCYQACWCWHSRKHTFHYLQSFNNVNYNTNNGTHSMTRVQLQISSVTTPAPNSFHQISFQLSYKGSPDKKFKVTMHYKDWIHALPKRVDVAMNDNAVGLSIAKTVETTFITHSIEKALQALTEII